MNRQVPNSSMQKSWPVVIFIIAAVAFWKGLADADSEDPVRTTGSYEGRNETELRAGVGPPVRERRVDGTNANGPCARRGDQVERELTYDVPSRGLGKQFRDFFALSPATSFVACVDRSGKITGVSQIDY